MAPPINRDRLFFGICFALVPTAASFAIVGDILGALKSEFILTNYQVGLIGGAALWGMAISQILLGSLADFGMRAMMRAAFASHLLGVAIMLSASISSSLSGAFWALFAGAIVLGLGNGFVEVAGNPLVAALYPENKVTKLNHFHGWFPGGMVIAGLASFALGFTPFGSWTIRLGLTFIPILIYGALLLREPFPQTEGVQAGVPFGQMFRATFTSPLFLVMLFAMMITASLELGPMRWIPAVLQSGGIPGILVLVWISGLMAVLRFYAGPLVERLSPTGLLLGSALVSGAGLYLLSFVETATMAFVTATVFAVGVAFFWPTMLGFVNERIPRSGALGLGLMGGIGMTITGLVTIPVMGDIADQNVPDRLPAQETAALLQDVTTSLPPVLAQVPEARRGDVQQAINLSAEALEEQRSTGALPGNRTANALRAVISSGVEAPVVGRAQQLLGPAENYGGRVSFRYVAPLALIIIAIFGFLYSRDRRAGGYRAERIGLEPEWAAPNATADKVPAAGTAGIALLLMLLAGCAGRGGGAAAEPTVLIVGGGASHDFPTWFQRADSATLAETGARPSYTADPATVAAGVRGTDVLYLSNNQALPDPAARTAIFDHVAGGKGLVIGHAAAWYNWRDWPEYNQRLVGGGTRAHRKYGDFTVQVTQPNHPVMAGVPASFQIRDELYRFTPDPAGSRTTVLATAREEETGTVYPIVWTVEGQGGRIVVNTLGHDGEAHNHAAYRRILQNSLRWASGR